MKLMINSGPLTYNEYLEFFNKKFIISKNFDTSQLQPSSIDLTLSEECYKISSSFLSPMNKVRNKLDKFIQEKLNLQDGYIFKKNITYLVKLNETLNLPKKIFGKCNPKSTTGRLDIFCRTILDYSDEYEKIPAGYSGEIYLEITSHAFDIKLQKGDSLNQMRLVNEKNNILYDQQLLDYHYQDPLVFDNCNNIMKPIISSGLKISVDLDNQRRIVAYRAKKKSPVLIFNNNKSHKVEDFWEPIKTLDNSLTIIPGEFYILKSKQKIRIPKTMAGEMIPYDTAIGDFRAHYAGFFDPGFGSEYGSFAVFEIKTNEVTFTIEDNQIIATLIYENLNKIPDVLYGSSIHSNYQNQELALSKHFNVLRRK